MAAKSDLASAASPPAWNLGWRLRSGRAAVASARLRRRAAATMFGRWAETLSRPKKKHSLENFKYGRMPR